MDTPFKTITYLESKEALHAPDRQQLVLVPQENRISYLVRSEAGTAVISKSFLNEKNLASSVFFRMVLEREALHQQAFASHTILSATAQFVLVPNEELRPGYDDAYHYTRILLDESAFRQEVNATELPGLEARALFVVPLPVRYLWDEYLPSYKLGHVVAPLLDLARQLSAEAPSHLLLQLFDNMVVIVACDVGKVTFCNSFRFRAEMDIVYFLNSVREVTGLADDGLPVYTIGEFDQQGQAFHNLQTYVPQLQIPGFLKEKVLGSGGADSPFWKFGLLSL